MHQVVYSREAEKTLRRLPGKLRALIEGKIARLAENPRGTPNVKRLEGWPGAYRLRVGDWRVVYTLDEGRLVITVITIATRGGVYRQ